MNNGKLIFGLEKQLKNKLFEEFEKEVSNDNKISITKVAEIIGNITESLINSSIKFFKIMIIQELNKKNHFSIEYTTKIEDSYGTKQNLNIFVEKQLVSYVKDFSSSLIKSLRTEITKLYNERMSTKVEVFSLAIIVSQLLRPEFSQFADELDVFYRDLCKHKIFKQQEKLPCN